jgi:hypothetical protein
VTTSSVLSRRRLRGRRDSRISDISDRLAEDARIFLLIVERQQTSYDVALDGLVRDAFGSADRLRAAAAAARAGGWPTAVVDLLERGADRAEHAQPPRPRAGRLGAGTVRQAGTSATAAAPKQPAEVVERVMGRARAGRGRSSSRSPARNRLSTPETAEPDGLTGLRRRVSRMLLCLVKLL